ncbi:MAG: SDR family oxidoreductase [Planctomycetes bacterium]|nr:SDR family oxidoreductase [Planctomycetota bacterium]
MLVVEREAELDELITNASSALKEKGTDGAWQLPNVYFGGPGGTGKLAFLFPGQGSQYVGMGRDVVCNFPEAFDAIAEADSDSAEDERLSERVYPQPTFSHDTRVAQEEELKRTEITQPALGAVSLALLRVLKRFGVEPDFAAGHSFGELVALRTAGRIGDQALRTLGRLRGRLMGEGGRDDGAMLAVQAPLEEIDELLAKDDDDVVLANRNTPTQGIISGLRSAVEKVGQACEQRGWRTRMLQVSAAFHSKFMAPAQERFRTALEEITFELGRIPVFANVTAALYPDDVRGVRDLLARQLTSPVNFVEQIRNLYDAGARTFVEVGPKNVLTGLVKNILRGKPLHALALDAGLGRGSGVADLARGLALLTVLGYSVDLQAWERPALEDTQPSMAVSLLGCNYRNPAKTPPEIHKPAISVTQQQVGNISMTDAENGSVSGPRAVTPGAAASADQLAQAFQVVQEGLRSMQALQQQTAAAHERFLQTQEQAQQTLQMVITQQQQLLAGALSSSEALPMPMADSTPASPPVEPVASSMPAKAVPAVDVVATGGNGNGQASGASGDGEFGQIVLEAVSELTGYPVEMLDLDMDMEADLGIDSIKRLEILGAVQRRVPQMAEVNSQYLGSLRTLRNIIEYARDAGQEVTASPDPTLAPAQPSAPSELIPDKSPAAKLERRVLTSVELAPARQRPLRIAKGHEIWVTDDGTPLAPTIVKRLDALGHAARLIGPRAGWRNSGERKVGGLILLAAPKDGNAAAWDETAENELKAAFRRAQKLGANLRAAAKEGGALLATVSRLDGGFGLHGGSFNALQGGLSGLAKTVAHEWPEVQCRALDVSRAWQDADAITEQIVCELGAEGPTEVGLDEGRRIGLELVSTAATDGNLPLDDGDVVVISGGARGVTAEAALALTQVKRPVLVLLGRSPEPTPEPDWLVGREREADIKRILLSQAFDGSRPTPAELEAEYRRRMANREVARNLERLRDAGATVVYRSVDVRDQVAVASLLDEVRAEHGPARGLIHAAGVLADHRIEDKTPEQFGSVFDTKVRGLRALLDVVRDDALKFMVFFSSVSGRFGRAGQVDYAMASEVLNKVAHQQAALRPGCRVVSINWGPWDGGMVTPSLKQEFVRLGIELIPPEAGARHLVEELCVPAQGAVEVVVGCSFPESARPPTTELQRRPGAVSRNGEMFVAFERELNVETHPFLRSHVLDGHPVLPMVMMLEWLGHGALHDNPGLHLYGLEDFRVLKGVILNNGPRAVQVVTSRARRHDETFEVDVELRSREGDTEALHARAKASLTTRLPESPVFELPAELHERPFAPGVAGAYRDILFHGPHFQGLEGIAGMSKRGIVAHVRSAPTPAEWMSEPLRSSWLGDPLVIDAGLQLGVLWCHEQLGALALPSYKARYRQYRPFPRQGVTAVLEVGETGPHRLAGRITFVDAEGRVVAQSEGCEWTVDASLRRAFARNELVGV